MEKSVASSSSRDAYDEIKSKARVERCNRSVVIEKGELSAYSTKSLTLECR